MKTLLAALLALAAAAAAQDVPSGWKVVSDIKNSCQIAVPPDWTTDPLVKSMAMSPDKKSTAVSHGQRQGISLSQAVDTFKKLTPNTKTVEESSSRVWLSYPRPGGNPGTEWYVAVPGAQVCTATITFEDPATEAMAKKIALSLKSTK
jgi:hypothetical protein